MLHRDLGTVDVWRAVVSKHASVFHLLAAGVPYREYVHSAGAAEPESRPGGPSDGQVGHAAVVRGRVRVAVDVGVRSGRSSGACR